MYCSVYRHRCDLSLWSSLCRCRFIQKTLSFQSVKSKWCGPCVYVVFSLLLLTNCFISPRLLLLLLLLLRLSILPHMHIKKNYSRADLSYHFATHAILFNQQLNCYSKKKWDKKYTYSIWYNVFDCCNLVRNFECEYIIFLEATNRFV